MKYVLTESQVEKLIEASVQRLLNEEKNIGTLTVMEVSILLRGLAALSGFRNVTNSERQVIGDLFTKLHLSESETNSVGDTYNHQGRHTSNQDTDTKNPFYRAGGGPSNQDAIAGGLNDVFGYR